MSFERDESYENEDILEWCLDPSSRTPEAESALEADPELRLTLQEFESSVSGLRESLRREESRSTSVGEKGLVADILRATTREDLSRRGDLRLVRDYIGRSLRSSWVMRVVAASLVIHLSALPILGFILLTQEPKPHFNLWLEPPVELPFEETSPEPAREVDESGFVDPEELDALLRDEQR